MPEGDYKPEDYYSLLGLGPGATVAQIERAFRRLAKRHHPDAVKVGGGTPADVRRAEETFSSLSLAYSILTDREKRRKYDLLYYHYYPPKDRSAPDLSIRAEEIESMNIEIDVEAVYKDLFGGEEDYRYVTAEDWRDEKGRFDGLVNLDPKTRIRRKGSVSKIGSMRYEKRGKKGGGEDREKRGEDRERRWGDREKRGKDRQRRWGGEDRKKKIAELEFMLKSEKERERRHKGRAYHASYSHREEQVNGERDPHAWRPPKYSEPAPLHQGEDYDSHPGRVSEPRKVFMLLFTVTVLTWLGSFIFLAIAPVSGTSSLLMLGVVVVIYLAAVASILYHIYLNR